MIATMDRAGRAVVPKEIRNELGFVPGDVELTVQGTRVLIEQPTSHLREEDGHLLLPLGGSVSTPDEARELRFADQR